MKLGRTYTMTIQVDPLGEPNNSVVVNFPLTLTFEISRSTLASANTGRFTIYNLKESTRKRIFKDRYATLPADQRSLVLRAGYVQMTEKRITNLTPLSLPSTSALFIQDPNLLPVVFSGDILSAYSYRRGSDWITEIEAFDGLNAMTNSQAAMTFPAGRPLRDMIVGVAKTLLGTELGVVGDFTGNSSRSTTLSGNSYDILKGLAQGGEVFIDTGKVNVLQKNEYIAGSQGISLISSDTGLLGTPKRSNALILAEMIFEPRAVVGQLVQLRSEETINNGDYEIKGVAHRGTISGAVDGGVTTTASLWVGTERLKGALR